jgi:hypothetical protein
VGVVRTVVNQAAEVVKSRGKDTGIIVNVPDTRPEWNIISPLMFDNDDQKRKLAYDVKGMLARMYPNRIFDVEGYYMPNAGSEGYVIVMSAVSSSRWCC